MRKRPAGERKPRKPVLSPTKIETYLACPLLYKLIYIDKLGRYLYKPKVYHSFGSSLHRALSDYHTAGGADSETAADLLTKLHDRWVSIGYTSKQEEREYLETAAEILQEYHSAHVEPGEKTLLIERQLKYDMGDFILAGRVDRLVETADGTINVIDYKSGRETVSEDDVKYSLAMSIYQLLASKNYPGKSVAGTIYCLRTNIKATVSLSTEELAELEDEILAIGQEILKIDADTIIEPVYKEICDECDFLSRCKRHAMINGEEWG